VTALRRADVCAFEPGPAPRKHAPPKAVHPRRPMGVWGCCRAIRPIPGRIFGAEASPRVAQAERRCAGVCSLKRGNLAARHADGARLVDQSGKKGWKKLDGSQRGQVHPELIWQEAVGARPLSRERTWPLSFLGCRIAAGPCYSQSRLEGKAGVKCDKRGVNSNTMLHTPKAAQLSMLQVIALNFPEHMLISIIDTSYTKLRGYAENRVFVDCNKPGKCSIW